ncbi:hypothetical protein E2C01_060673 [Portunus trituberculatus]|uniref:Uncharacterized protein n=1 Tax=Portunus trituberculatus TaxID=210409 RepID=A0A5B7HCS2_PORTR|nr:hypothetical protein [Portunus trituberculatus]
MTSGVTAEGHMCMNGIRSRVARYEREKCQRNTLNKKEEEEDEEEEEERNLKDINVENPGLDLSGVTE